jgi:ribose transport system permease protein
VGGFTDPRDPADAAGAHAAESRRPRDFVSRLELGRTTAQAVFRLRDFPILVVLVLIVGVVSVFHPDYLSQSSLINTSRLAAYYGSMAIGMVFLLSMREIDLSVGAIFGLTVVAGARFMELDVHPWLAGFLALGVGPLCGLVNGLISNALRIQTIITTLGTLSMFSAISLLISGERIIVDMPIDSSFFHALGDDHLSLPMSIWTFIVLLVVMHVVYRYMRFGSNVRAIGANPEAARLAGIRVDRMRVWALMLQGLLCSIIGVVTLAYLQVGEPTTGRGYELSVIAAAIVGGTALSGGQGSVIGAGIGALIISAISTGLVQFGATPDWGIFATGAMIIAAVALDAFIKRRRMMAAEGALREGGT